MWEYLVQHAQDYGFLGPIVGIVGVLLGATSAIILGWTRTLDSFKPPDDLIKPLGRIVTVLCAVGMFVGWILAEPTNGPAYLRTAIWLSGACAVSFLVYIGLKVYCGRFKKDTPTGQETIWGGFWLTK